MGFLGTFLGILGLSIGISIGLVIGFFLFVNSKCNKVKDPIVTPIQEMDSSTLLEILPEIPYWIKSPDYERIDWLNEYILAMWPFLDKAICDTIRSTVTPMFADYIGMYQINDIEFEKLSLGSLPPIFHGMKVSQTNESQLVLEPAVKWAANTDIVLVVTLMSVKIRFQLVDLQVFVCPRIYFKPLMPAFPCFANITVSLMEKPYVDFGLKVMGGDIMCIPGVCRFVQETIKQQVASLYHWPQFLEIPIIDTSTASSKKPVGILHVNVIRATKLKRKDVIGGSDPYVKLKVSDQRMPPKRTSMKRKNLNPEWNERFNLIVKDNETQALELEVSDWDKVGGDDNLGVQVVQLKELTPHEPKNFVLDLLKNTDVNDGRNKKARGKLEFELTFKPFKLESESIKRVDMSKESVIDATIKNVESGEPGVLLVTVIGAEDLEATRHHTNAYAQILFRGEKRRSTRIKKNRNPRWNEVFEFMVEDPPSSEMLRIEAISKRRSFGFTIKESLGFVDISLADVVNNGRINEKYDLINSKNGVIQVVMEWQM